MNAIAAVACSGRSSDQATKREPTPAPSPALAAPADAMPPLDAMPPVDAMAPPDAPSAEQLRVDKLVHELDTTPFIDAMGRVEAMDRGTLESLARHADCGWAVRAAVVLERRGDPSFLPHRGAANDPAVLARMLCMIANLPTPNSDGLDVVSRQHEFLTDFLPARGKVLYSTQGCGDDGNIGPVERSTFTRSDATGDELDDRFLDLFAVKPGNRPGDVVVMGEGHATATNVVLSPAKDGRLYISSIEYQSMGACD